MKTPQKPLRILFVLELYPPHIGGVEVLFQNLCQGLAARGHEVTVITSRLSGTKALETINGVTVYRVRVPQKRARYWFTLLAIPQVLKLARKADVIHTTTYNGALPAWVVSKLWGKKCIITVHEVLGRLWGEFMGMGWLSARQHRLLEKLIVSLPFDRYVGVSKYTCESLRAEGIGEARLRVVYNGIDSVLFDPARADGKKIRKRLKLGGEFVYFYFGRPGVSKGVEYLIRAVPIISEILPDSRLVLILAHDPRGGYERVKRMIGDLNLKDKVFLLDPVPRNELPGYIAASDCVVVPSLSEGFGFTAVEACTMGKPVVASDVASLPEVVSGKYILVEPGNPKAIADGVVKVCRGEVEDSPKKAFSWDECVEGYLDIYREVTHA